MQVHAHADPVEETYAFVHPVAIKEASIEGADVRFCLFHDFAIEPDSHGSSVTCQMGDTAVLTTRGAFPTGGAI